MNASLRTKLLRRQKTLDEYRAYRAALEWDLEDPIVIESRDDFKSEYRWRDRLEPYHHQVTNLITFCRRLPVTLLADDVGLGKTISAGLVISELLARARISKVLVVCPKLLGPQWKEELEAKFDFPAEVAAGRRLLAAEPSDAGAVITTYASARLHLDAVPEDRFQMLVLDEAHKLRNLYGVETTPQVAKVFRNALQQRRFKFVLMLTATPIHNRLWDLYSLVDLLTVARGHQNPFGSEGAFARKFIADNREQARHLKQDAKKEFRDIVYGYMSRIRRGDAKLYFPEREVQMHRVLPTRAELQLIDAIAEPIQELNRLAQISILQALASSPDALTAQLNNMARNRTVPAELAALVRSIVQGMPPSAKLIGLQALIDELKRSDPKKWRLVVFTTRLETQTTIQMFLEKNGLKVGIINGSSASRNQETIAGFRSEPPQCHVIVSTEAGSEGVNLQVANVLVNFDLPWNPMIVEQRIGRVQRLASKHAKVAIFNIMLKGTFEEYIVGRLMEKLQMASHAIGDIEALLEASGINDDEAGDVSSFEDMVRQLVVAALAGQDVEVATKKAAESIERAKTELEKEQSTINDLLGNPSEGGYVGPRVPTLPLPKRATTSREFVLLAFQALGLRVRETDTGHVIEENGGEEMVHFEGETPEDGRSTLYAPGTPAFSRLVNRLTASGVHNIRDLDIDVTADTKRVMSSWVARLGFSPIGVEVKDAYRRFAGEALVKVRATVAHDSYERLVPLTCSPESGGEPSRASANPLAGSLDDPRAIGLTPQRLIDLAQQDEAIGEFCRFYLERRELEVQAAGGDERKKKKLEDEFTPRLEMSLVGLDGEVFREVDAEVTYKIDDEQYSSLLFIRPSSGEILRQPPLSKCAKSGREAPLGCIEICQISKAGVLKHLLKRSAKSGRAALPEFLVTCGLTGKPLLQDEVEPSGVTGRLIDKALLLTSPLSGTRAEPENFASCQFTGDRVLKTELEGSQLSGKGYRKDQVGMSAISGKVGHKSEFVNCAHTGDLIARIEAAKCEITANYARPDALVECAVTSKKVLPSQVSKCDVSGKTALKTEMDTCAVSGKFVLRSELGRCEVSGKRVLPSELVVCDITGKRALPIELDRCVVTGKRALKTLLVSSSVSGTRLLQTEAIRSATGEFCGPAETGLCAWSDRRCHPADLRTCGLTGLPILFQFAGSAKAGFALLPLAELLDGLKRTEEMPNLWPTIAAKTESALGKGRCKVEAAALSPSGKRLATSIEVRTLLGFRVQQAGAVYALDEASVVGRIRQGQRKNQGWVAA